MLTEKTTHSFRILPEVFYQIEVREETTIYKDDTPYGNPQYHRYVLAPGDNIDEEYEDVKAVANVLWTEEVIQNYKKSLNNSSF